MMISLDWMCWVGDFSSMFSGGVLSEVGNMELIVKGKFEIEE